jgi:hypothetical protein
MSSTPSRVVRGAVQVRIWEQGHNIVALVGVISEPDVARWLQPLLEDIHQAALVRGLDEVILDIRNLEYANAALWKCLVVWLKRIREPRERIYGLRLRANDQHRWQQIGVPTLRIFGADRLRVDTT